MKPRYIPGRLSRREVVKLLATGATALPLGFLTSQAWGQNGTWLPPQNSSNPAIPLSSVGATPKRYDLTPSDDAFLEDIQHASFLYFWEQTNPDTGLVKDRCNVRATDNKLLGSIASTGFGLTALCIGENRGYVSYAQARDRTLATLRFLWKKLHNQRGFF